jgi:RNA recognition motif-containing protein
LGSLPGGLLKRVANRQMRQQMQLYVGNLEHSVTDTDLKKLFSTFGKVAAARVVFDHYTRQSKGFGYVVMAEIEAGAHAIAVMNGAMLHNRPLIVNEARPRDMRLGQGW